MRTILALPLLVSAYAWSAEPIDAAIAKVIATFNQTSERASVLAPNADLRDLDKYRQQEVSQMYFEIKSVRWVLPDVAVVEATGSQFGSLVVHRSVPATFTLVRSHGAWRITRLTLRSAYPTGGFMQ
jgi:hypothetical protein